MEVNCIQLINKLNIAARQYRLSPLAQLVFLRIWERHNLNRWEDEWVPYTDADLMHDVQEKSRQRLYRAKMELERVHILLHKTDTNRTQTYTLVALEPQGVEGDACTQSVHKTDISRTSNDTQNRVPSYISIKDIKDKDINIYIEKEIYKEIEPDVLPDLEIEPPKEKKPKKKAYGEYKKVLLTDEEYEKLKAEFPADWQDWIDRADGYCAQNGKRYKNFLATIRNWARRDKERGANIGNRPKGNAKSRLGETAGEGDKFVGDFMSRIKQRYAERGVHVSG